MSDELPPPLRRASDRAQAEFRRRVAYYSMLVLTLVAGALITRDTDIGPNAASLLGWIVLAFAMAIVGAMSAKAAESIATTIAATKRPP